MRFLPLSCRTAVCCAAIIAALGPAAAHDGHAATPVTVAVLGTDATTAGLSVTFSVHNTGHAPIGIVAISSDVGALTGVDLPHYVLGGATDILTTTLDTEAETPGIFTLFMDFGDMGAGPVLVIPDV